MQVPKGLVEAARIDGCLSLADFVENYYADDKVFVYYLWADEFYRML